MGILLTKLKESLVSVLPVTVIVCLLNLTPLVNFSNTEIIVFLVSSVFLILGIGLFNMGADLAMTPMGEHIGAGLTKSKKVILLLSVCFLMGLFITVAEPDLSILADQVSAVINGNLLIAAVGVGVGAFLVLSVVKMIFHRPLSSMLLYFYMILFALAALVIINGNVDFLAMGFDSGGVTIGGRDVGENSFGLIAMCSVGPILAVMLLGVTITGDMQYQVADYSIAGDIWSALLHTVVHMLGKVGLALGLIVAFFIIRHNLQKRLSTPLAYS